VKKRKMRRRNPVAKALAQPALKNRIVPKRFEEKRARDKLRRLLRAHEHRRLYSANARAIETG
jgi:hypothetical protein